MRIRSLALGVVLLSVLALLPGCGPGKPPVQDFSVDVDNKTSTLNVRYKGQGSLNDCNITVNVQCEDGNNLSIPRFWSFWDETKKIELPRGVKVEKVEITGTATREISGKSESVTCYYLERIR